MKDKEYILNKYPDIFNFINDYALIVEKGEYTVYNKEKQYYFLLESDHDSVVQYLKELNVKIVKSESDLLPIKRKKETYWNAETGEFEELYIEEIFERRKKK